MKDLTIAMENRPGALAEVGEALQHGGVSVEGGGAFVVNNQGVAHFLVQDGAAARRALESAGNGMFPESFESIWRCTDGWIAQTSSRGSVMTVLVSKDAGCGTACSWLSA